MRSLAEAAARGAVGDVAGVGDVQHQSQVDQVEAHDAKVAFGPAEGYRRHFRIVTVCG